MKVPTGLSRIDQETFFRGTAADKVWDFYTRDPKFKRLLERRGYTVTEDHQGLWTASIPLRALSVRRVMTHEERERRRELAKNLRRDGKKNTVEGKTDSQVDPEIGVGESTSS